MFRTTLTLAVGMAIGLAGATASFAQTAKAEKKPAKAPRSVKAEAPTAAEVQAQIHRTMAVLIEARSADKPDQQQIDKLTAKLEKLHEKLWSQRSTVPPGRAGAGMCPWGGPRMGYGPGQGGPGRGYGRGGFGWGGGPGRGMGRGWGVYVDQDKDGVCDNYETIWGPQK